MTAKEEWYLSPDGEYYDAGAYDSRDEAVYAGCSMFRAVETGQAECNDLYPDGKAGRSVLDRSFYVGKRADWWPSVDVDLMLDSAIDQAADFAGEYAEGWLEVTDEQRESLRAMLQGAFDKWIDETGNQPGFIMIERSEAIDPHDYEIMVVGS